MRAVIERYNQLREEEQQFQNHPSQLKVHTHSFTKIINFPFSNSPSYLLALVLFERLSYFFVIFMNCYSKTGDWYLKSKTLMLCVA